MSGPLTSVRVLELAGKGPAPFAGMLLADLGADVIRVDRFPGVGLGTVDTSYDLLGRGKRSIVVDLKQKAGRELFLAFVERVDAVIDPFRPGVVERLGIGPEECCQRNPSVVFARMTGWGQDGPIAGSAGHDINYLALAGALASIGEEGRPPPPPVNFVADFGGGGMLLAFGIACAIVEREHSGLGQVLDVAMLDGVALLTARLQGLLAAGEWSVTRGTNRIDGGAPYYRTYETADGKYMAVGAIEPQFYRNLLYLTGLTGEEVDCQDVRDRWPALHERLGDVFRSRTQAEWTVLAQEVDACVVPVLTLEEAPMHPHNRFRRTFVTVDGIQHPGPAPRFHRSGSRAPEPPPPVGAHTEELLKELGIDRDQRDALRATGCVA